MSKRQKPHINLIIIGHVDHGKSTTVGHMFYKAGAIPEKQLKDLEAEDKAMGGSQAEGAVLMISAKRGEYEAGTNPGGQTREHAFLAKTLGVNQLVVGVNKMDDASVNWSQQRYEEVKDGMSRLLKMVGYDASKIHFVPTSGWTGDNLVKKRHKMPWYTGPTLLDALDTFELPPKPTDTPLRIPVQEIYTIRGVGTTPVGKVETGALKPGEDLSFMPSKRTGKVNSIETH